MSNQILEPGGKMPTERTKPQNLTAEVIDIVDETPNTKRFFYKVKDQESFDFIPGQFVILELPIHEKKARRLRSYSIASPPTGEPYFETAIVYKDGGVGTDYLFNQVKPGTEIPFKGPSGKFNLPETLDQEVCFICTGTGITPFRSMLHYIREHNIPHPKIHLIFGTRRISDILYFGEMQQLEQELEGFRYIPVLSREDNPEWEGSKGYVHPVYEEIFKDLRPANFYLCGWQDMITEARERLKNMGYEKSNIHFESYG